MRTPDAGRVLEFEGAALQDFQEFLQVLLQDGVGLLDEVSVGRIHDVGGGEAVVDPLALRTEAFADGPGEGDDIMPGNLLDLLDAGDVEPGGGADLVHVLAGDDAEFAPGFAGEDFHLEVRLELVLLGPDVPHHFAGVALDHIFFRNCSMLFSMRAAISSPSAFSKGTPVICS